jgi:hypothetical protein
MNAVELPHSPPAEKPCSSRATTSSAGARYPMVANVGRTPISTVPIAISRMVMSSAALRPRTSPMRPITMPPSGRARKPSP